MMTNPPPNESAPTLNATQATDASPPTAAAGTASGPSQAAAPSFAEGLRTSNSATPQPTSTTTTNPPDQVGGHPAPAIR